KLVLVPRSRDLVEELGRVEPDRSHDFAQHVVAADVATVAPVALEHAPRILRQRAMLFGHERAAHRLDRVHREYRRLDDLESVETRPVLEILAVVARLGFHRT